MDSFYVFPALLWVCLFAQAPAENVKITKITRTVSATDMEFVVKFDAGSSTPEAEWWKFSAQTYQHLKATSRGSGKTKLVIPKADVTHSKLLLWLGDLKAHFWELEMNADGDDDRTLAPDLPMAEVTPGTDVGHEVGETSSVIVRADEKRGKGFDFYNFELYPTGMNKDGIDLMYYEAPPFLNTSYTTQNGNSENNLTFGLNWQKPINGFVTGVFEASISREANLPISWLSEYIVIKVHDKGISGPFPDDFIHVDLSMPTCKELWPGYIPCKIYCSCYANNLDKVEIYKVENGVEVKQEETVINDVSSYGKTFALTLSPESSAGDYICVASAKGGFSTRVKGSIQP